MDSAPKKDFVSRLRQFLRLDKLSPTVRCVIVGILGGVVLLAGIAMIFLPGPAFIVIPLGLTILALEFNWARNYLHRARDYFEKMKKRHRKKTAS